jgi:hypothetical protein
MVRYYKNTQKNSFWEVDLFPVTPPGIRLKLLYRSRSHFTTGGRSVSQHVLVSSTLVGLATRYYFVSECCCLKFAILFVWGVLSNERTGLQFAVQSLNGPSRAEPVTILYGLIWDSPSLEGQIPVFISPRNRAAQLYPRALDSLCVDSYDSQGGVLTLPLPGGTGPRIYTYPSGIGWSSPKNALAWLIISVPTSPNYRASDIYCSTTTFDRCLETFQEHVMPFMAIFVIHGKQDYASTSSDLFMGSLAGTLSQ